MNSDKPISWRNIEKVPVARWSDFMGKGETGEDALRDAEKKNTV